MSQQFRVLAALSKDPNSIPSSHMGCPPTACSSSSIDLTCVSRLQYLLPLPHASQCLCLQLIASLLGNLDNQNNLHSLLVRTKSPIFRSLLRFRPSTPLQGRDFLAGSQAGLLSLCCAQYTPHASLITTFSFSYPPATSFKSCHSF